MKSEWALREDIVEVGKRLYQAGYIRGADGNLSVRMTHDEVLITPSRSAKGFLDPKDLVVVDLQGNLIAGGRQPSLETFFHLAIYREREEVRAVVHAHPPRTIAFTVANRDIPQDVLPEITILFPHGVPVIPYETPATERLGEEIRTAINIADAVILSHHGIIGVGQDIYEAWATIEHVEACVEVLSIASTLGGITSLPRHKLHELEGIRTLVQEARSRNF